MINGVINVYKEPGYTSHDVVAKLRGILKTEKNRPYGNLDPNAVRSVAGLSWESNEALQFIV